eukprot:7672303-Pyramimonas_sp.AAC.1
MPPVFFTFTRVLSLHLTDKSPLDPLWTPSGPPPPGHARGPGHYREGVPEGVSRGAGGAGGLGPPHRRP